MLKLLRNFILISCLVISTAVFAVQTNPLFTDHTKLVTQQIDLLKNRLAQANHQLLVLQSHSAIQISYDQVSTQLLKQLNLDIAVAKSNMDSIDIELTESQQTTARIEKHIQDLENQLNILNVFGLKIARSGATPNLSAVQAELDYQNNLLKLAKIRLDYLQQLQETATKIFFLNKSKYRRVEVMLRSQTIMRLKVQQEKAEINFQRQQTYWLQQLNDLYVRINQIETSKNSDKSQIAKLESDIFFANENVNFTYLQMLIARYQDQIRQYKVSISRSISINLLNKISDQAQLLGKQLSRVDMLLKTRIDILEKRKQIITQQNIVTGQGVIQLESQYKDALTTVSDLNEQLTALRGTLDHALQQELSSRQGLPGFGSTAWLDLGQQLLWVPTLTFQMMKSLGNAVYETFDEISWQWSVLLVILELAWIGLFYFLHLYFVRMLSGMDDHEGGHINLKWLGINLFHRNLIEVALLGNIYGLFGLCGIPTQNFMFILSLGIVWLVFKSLITAAKLIIVESVHDHQINVRQYVHLRWILLLGAVISMVSVFVSQLPIIYEVKDLFDRVFLLYVFIISLLLIKSWKYLPGLVLPYIDDRHTYIKKIVSSLGLFVPLILLMNSAIGLFGYVNLVLTISWYECVFLVVTVGYLILRGILIELLERASYILIRHVTNGWLWTEAFLKPVDKVLRITLFLSAWSLLFLLYGWDAQSPVVERLNKLLHYNMLNVLNTTITPLSVIEVFVMISLLFWAARWSREFVYRFLLSRTKDLGLRNSIAILSQYATIVVGVLIILRVLGIDFRALAVVTGMFFFGVGLGLRDLFNNFACGFLLLIERPVKVGDIVAINGYEGDVIHIGSRAVTIRTWDHMELLIPNTEIFSKAFVNWTAKDNIVRTVLSIKVNRHDDPNEIQKLVHDVLVAHKSVLKDPDPEVLMKEMTDEIEFEVRYYINIRSVKSRISVRSEVLTQIWEVFDKHQIKPPYQQREIVIKNT